MTDLSSVSGASYITDISHCPFFLAVALSIYERPGNLQEASKFVLLWVHFLRHFVWPILPRVRELVPGFTNMRNFKYKQNGDGKEITNFLGFPVFHAKLQQQKWQRCNDLQWHNLCPRLNPGLSHLPSVTCEMSLIRVICWTCSEWDLYFCFFLI